MSVFINIHNELSFVNIGDKSLYGRCCMMCMYTWPKMDLQFKHPEKKGIIKNEDIKLQVNQLDCIGRYRCLIVQVLIPLAYDFA